jgi:hypothetical protein
MKNLRQFYIGQFEVRVDDADLQWLKNDIEDRMLMRGEEGTGQEFSDTCKF